MKRRMTLVLIVAMAAVLVLAGCQGAPQLSIVGIYTQESGTGGALVTALDGTTPFQGEFSATVNGVDLIPFFSPGVLVDYSLPGNLVAGDTVKFVVQVEGEEVINDSVAYPGDLTLTTVPSNPSASSPILIEWNPVPAASSFALFVTESGADEATYEVLSLPAGTTSHSIPANTLTAGTDYDLLVEALKQKTVSGDGVGANSAIVAASADSYTLAPQ